MMKTQLAWMATALLLASLGCAQQTPELPPLETPAAEPTPAYEFITREETNERIRVYLALNAWAETTQEIAREHTQDFRKVMFSSPDRECADDFREEQVIQPDLPPDALFQCVSRGIRGLDDRKWPSMSPDEREARTRRTYILLSGSIDPPEYLAVSIAANKGIRVTTKNDPEFARLKREYQDCHELGQEMALRMTDMTDPDWMAAQWLGDTEALKECFTNTTNRIYELNAQELPDETTADPIP